MGIVIEATQHVLNMVVGFHYRSVDIDDIILNALGGMAGYLVQKFVRLIYHSTKQYEEK